MSSVIPEAKLEVPSTGDPTDREVLISNVRGLHARAASKFVKLAGDFDARVEVTNVTIKGDTVSGESIMGLLMLAASKGTTIRLSAKGNQAHEALDALCQLVEAKFYED